MVDKIKIQDGNVLIYVFDLVRLYNTAHLFVIEASEKPKSYETIRAYEYAGNGMVQAESMLSLRIYKKSDKRVFLTFEEARKVAVKELKALIESQEEKIEKNKKKLLVWES